MMQMRCEKPYCGRIYKETDEEYQERICRCGFELTPHQALVYKQEQVVDAPPAPALSARPAAEVASVEPPAVVAADANAEEAVEEESSVREDTTNIPYLVLEDGKLVFPEDAEYKEQLVAHGLEFRQNTEKLPADRHSDYKGDRIQIYYRQNVYQTVPLLYDEMTIGRENHGQWADIDLTFIDPEQNISRKHALIYRYNGDFYIRNQSAKNSLHVNGDPLPLNESMKLEDEDEIVLSGAFGLLFLRSERSVGQ